VNDPECPTFYSSTLASQSCPSIGLYCRYYGQGTKPLPADCSDNEQMWCVGDSGVSNTDGGIVDLPGTWVVVEN
jgi:hypothetical protein